MKYKDPSHPLKVKLRRLRVPQHVAAYNLGLNYTTFCKYLNGACRMPLKVEEKLMKFLEDVKTANNTTDKKM